MSLNSLNHSETVTLRNNAVDFPKTVKKPRPQTSNYQFYKLFLRFYLFLSVVLSVVSIVPNVLQVFCFSRNSLKNQGKTNKTNK